MSQCTAETIIARLGLLRKHLQIKALPVVFNSETHLGCVYTSASYLQTCLDLKKLVIVKDKVTNNH